MDGETEKVAGTAIARAGVGVLLRGPSGAGKSDLALRALASPIRLSGEETATAFQLISDDQTLLTRRDGTLEATAPFTIRNLLEVRGIGIVEVEAAESAPLRLVVDLAGEVVERLPDYPGRTVTILGCAIDALRLDPFEASAHIKLALALKRAG